MQLARSLFALSCASAIAACGTDVARAVNIAPLLDAGTPGIPGNPPRCTVPGIVARLQHSEIDTAEAVRYKRAGTYFFGFPQDERVALAPWGSDGAMVAWLDTTGTRVHVTMLTQQLRRLYDDLSDELVDGTEISGLVAHHDGFALLTRRNDPGEPLGGDAGPPPQATFLVRWQNRRELFAKPLTGTASIVDAPLNEKRDHPNVIPPTIATSGRLAHNGTNYGAYFTSQGAAGDRFAGISSDKLVQVDGSGQFVSGWRIGCQQSLGGRIIPETTNFPAFCMSDGGSGSGGVHAVRGASDTRRLDIEASWQNYVGGNFGSAVKVPTGYLLAWASRGYNGSGPWHEAHEPETMFVTTDLTAPGDSLWPFSTNSNLEPREDAVNVHAAPYGDKVLLVWETIASPLYRNGAGYGNYGGTHFRFVDGVGKAVSDDEEVVGASIAPNGQDDIVQFPNGDLGWAYVPEVRDFQAAVLPSNVHNLPPVKKIHFVRLPYCQP